MNLLPKNFPVDLPSKGFGAPVLDLQTCRSSHLEHFSFSLVFLGGQGWWKLKEKRKGKGKEERWCVPSLKHRHQDVSQLSVYLEESSSARRCPVDCADRSARASPTSC